MLIHIRIFFSNMILSPRQALLLLAALVAARPLTPARAAEPLRYNRDIRPLLAENCFHCHGPDSASRKSNLRLDRRDQALKPAKSGQLPIVPGKPDQSAVVKRLFTRDADDLMPPASTHKTLSKPQKELVRRWIAQGAEYESHWAFQPPARPSLPTVKLKSWPRNPLDFFVLARLEREKMRPSPPAEKSALIRRLSLDLTGLPPTPEEVDAFAADTSPTAYEKVVDRLLQSKHYGERMALPWLDAARYADSNGFQQDGDTFQYVWRDWVVRSLNADVPFDRFSIEQLAGDLLRNPATDQLIATAFNRNHLLNGEGGAIPEEQRYNNLFDRVDTTATTWMGLTMACAQCHDHKYDPITQRDYYSLLALFNNVPENGTPSGGGQYRVAEPSIQAGSPEDTAQLKVLEAAAAQTAQAERQITDSAATTAAMALWEKALAGEAAVDWIPLRPLSATAGEGVTLTVQEDLSIFVTGPRPDKASYTIKLPGTTANLTGLRLETIPDDRLPAKGAGRSDSGNAVLTRLRLSLEGKEIALGAATADYTQPGFSAAGAIDEQPETAWAIYPDTARPHALVVQTAAPVPNAAAAPLTVTLEFQSPHAQHQLGRFRLAATSAIQPVGRTALPAEIAAIVAKEPTRRSPEDAGKLRAQFLKMNPSAALQTARQQQEAAAKALVDFKNGLPRVMVMSDARPRQTHILERGNYLAPAAGVQGATPAFLPALAKTLPATRLDFARWLFAPEHPLTARVQVNRMWQTLFGAGLVKSVEDLGAQSEPPVQPELLDWLAVEFREHGWSMKHLNRLIVTSATYRQSSRGTREQWLRDPENRFLARGARFRAPAMMLRDVALAASGLLDRRIGGKPVYPYQPEAIWETLAITKERDFTYPASTGADLYRRSLYTFWRRTVGPANMFDASNRQVCKVRQNITNTPLHALTTLNDPTWAEAARVLAARSMGSAADLEGRLTFAFRSVLGRQPQANDLAALRRAFDRQLAIYRADPKSAAQVVAIGNAPLEPQLNVSEHAALSAVCLAILNLDEALTRE